MEIRPAEPVDLPQILALLEMCNLPPDGLTDHLGTALVGTQNDQIIASIALEVYGEAALLRSVAVAPDYRGQQLGHALVAAAYSMARRHQISALYLLTTTAGEFFPRFGFRPTPRAAVPPAVQQSVEFTSACPASALVMEAHLHQQ
jgi:amino-acid N-acetyltransferase